MGSKQRRVPRGIMVTAGFAAFIGASLALSYLVAQIPSQESACSTHCATRGKTGAMAYVYSATMTAGMRGKGPQECQCK
jgi:hypothetical protein